MSWQVVTVLLLVVPVVLFPVALVWFLNTGGITGAIGDIRRKRVHSKVEVRDDSEK
ncbi:MAG: hypothetical protein Q8O43_05900 [Dehalococcoidia bacterium]|nr:hypothetical protein [Dehalococcoidia bacterium]